MTSTRTQDDDNLESAPLRQLLGRIDAHRAQCHVAHVHQEHVVEQTLAVRAAAHERIPLRFAVGASADKFVGRANTTAVGVFVNVDVVASAHQRRRGAGAAQLRRGHRAH